jgi:hypothetical protein
MTTKPCVHEADVVAAVLSRTWPEACDATLRAHAESCEVCREVVEVAALLKEDHDEAREIIARRDVPLPSAGQIWWRAAVQARAEAARAATRPLVWGYGAAAACAIGLLVAGAGALWPTVVPAVSWLAGLADWTRPALALATDAAVTTVKARLPIVIGIAVCLAAAPIALYFALREEKE